jgi:hypothetical protein
MPTVRELIEAYGIDLIGRDIRLGDSMVVTFKGWNAPCQKAVIDDGQDGLIIPDDMDATLVQQPEPKTPFELLDLGFAAAMCHSWQLGVKHGRTANDWQHLPRTDGTRDRYVAKILRHLQAYVEAGDDRAVRCEHAAAIACDANILWHVEGRGE